MRYSLEHKQRTREAILGAAGRVFRSEGYGGSGIDGLTKEAGVTNGAFYGHFKTKSEAFREIVSLGLQDLHDGIERFQAEHGAEWLAAFVDYYLGFKRTCELAQSCALPSLSGEVVRSDDAARAAYGVQFRRVVAAMAAGLGPNPGAEDRAFSILALLSGAVTFARAVPDEALSARIAAAVRETALRLGASPAAEAAPARAASKVRRAAK